MDISYICSDTHIISCYICKLGVVYFCIFLKDIMQIDHSQYIEKSLVGRYITLGMLQESCFTKLSVDAIEIGKSVNGKAIKAFSLGTGNKRILMWSQMHGNESTTTKAVCDMFNFLQSDDPLAVTLLKGCTLMIVPMLNPDGSEVYTRENINKIDLNRDAKNKSQPESRALRNLFENFHPDYCFNLHDQRTLFSAGSADKPATVSFLSPASNPERDVTPSREVAMRLIVAMNNMLQEHIPGQVGRYDDGFNDNCVGDAFQMENVPTVLFEAGHFPRDYEREITRKYIFLALLTALQTIADDQIDTFDVSDYFNIPENQKLFFDILVKNGKKLNPIIKEGDMIGIRYKEVLDGAKIDFKPEIAEIGPLEGFYGHEVLDCADYMDVDALNFPKNLLELVSSASY